MSLPLRPRLAATALVLAAAPLMTGCGFNAATDRVYTPGVGMNERSGEVDVLNALIVSGRAGEGVFIAGLSNNDEDREDQLTQVQVQDAQVSGPAPVTIPPGGFVNMADGNGFAVTGDAKKLALGSFVTVVLTFADAEQVTLDVPIVEDVAPYEDITPGAAPSGSPSPTG